MKQIEAFEIQSLIHHTHETKRSMRTYLYKQGAAWRSVLYVWLVMWRSWVRAPSKAPVESLSKKLYPYCLLLVGSRNQRDFTIELRSFEGLMEDW